MVRQKIHWSPQPGWRLARRRKIGATSAYRGALSSREFVAWHEESRTCTGAGCAVVAADWLRRVTFASDEIEHLRALAEYVGRTTSGRKPEGAGNLER